MPIGTTTRPAKIPAPRDTKSIAALRYTEDSTPGITRASRRDTVQYSDSTGRLIRSKVVVNRIRALVIPPAWKDVWICKEPMGHLQATGRDARGRKQYLYHPLWREIRDDAKYEKLIEFAKVLPRVRTRVGKDLRRRGLPREKILAAIVRLMERSLIRVGNDEYARTNGSYGLTTLRDRHVSFSGSRMFFDFKGKSGVNHEIVLEDQQLVAIVRKCQQLPGQELFQYRDDLGNIRDVGSSDVNDYLQQITGGEFTAKDFRTWAGTSLAVEALLQFEEVNSLTEAKRNVVQAIAQVAKQLGNTKTVCRKSYIHPAVIRCYMNNTLQAVLEFGSKRARPKSSRGLSANEQRVLHFLEHQTSLISPALTGGNAKPAARNRQGLHSS